jgi:hypothetical protein
MSLIDLKIGEEGLIAFPQRDVHLDTSTPLKITVDRLCVFIDAPNVL